MDRKNIESFDLYGYGEWLGKIAFEFYSKYGLPKEIFLERLFRDPRKIEVSIVRYLEEGQNGNK